MSETVVGRMTITGDVEERERRRTRVPDHDTQSSVSQAWLDDLSNNIQLFAGTRITCRDELIQTRPRGPYTKEASSS